MVAQQQPSSDYATALRGRISVRVKVMWQLDRKIADISNIYVENVEMKKERLTALVDIIVSGRATNSCKNVTFSNTNLCGEGIVHLSKLVETSLQLQSVYLLHNRIDNMDSARCLSRSLKLHACITWLDLSHCDLGSNPEIFSFPPTCDLILIWHSNLNYRRH